MARRIRLIGPVNQLLCRKSLRKSGFKRDCKKSVGLSACPIPGWLVLAYPHLLPGILAHCHRTTNCRGGAPDHLRVMTAHFPLCATIADVVVIRLLAAPTIHHLPR